MVTAQPSIFINGLRLSEPVTTITDLIISAVCFYAFFRLTQLAERQKLHKYLKYYFLSTGIAIFVGGIIGHGLLYMFSSAWKLPGWLTSMLSVALIERASIEYARKFISPGWGKTLAWLNVLELLTFMALTFSSLNFLFVQIYATFGLLVVVSSLNIFIYSKTRDQGSKLFLIAVGYAVLAALVFMNKWSINMWFNSLDLSHVLLTISAIFFYKGSRIIMLSTRQTDLRNSVISLEG
jgi:hypothetical protein